MPKARRLLTNFSKGELSPRLEGRPDLAAYFEGAASIENFVLLRQGGLDRRVGTRFVAEVKDSAKDAILLPFEVSVDESFVVEVGDKYMRFFKDKAPILNMGIPVEIESPYEHTHVRRIHFTQSVDVLFLFHPQFFQRTLSHVDDLTWLLSPITYSPPPSFEADTDISQGTVNAALIVSVTRPLAGIVSGTVTVAISVAPGVSVKNIQVQRNAINFGALITGLPYSFPWDTTLDLDFTVYTLTAILTDVLDVVTTSLGVIVTVDNTAPPPPDPPPPPPGGNGGDGGDGDGDGGDGDGGGDGGGGGGGGGGP